MPSTSTRLHAGAVPTLPAALVALVTLSALILVSLTPATVAAAEPRYGVRTPTCAGEKATIVGTSGSDELTGTTGRDVVVALAGDDTIDTGPGPDVVCAGDDFDLVRSGAGRDLVLGGRGDDMVLLGGGTDAARGQGGIDSLFGGSGDDELRGGPGTSFVIEALVGGPGDDVLDGGSGLDTAQYFDAPNGVRVDLRTGRSTGHGSDTLIGIDGAVGSNHDDVIIGNADGNGLYGQEGDDVIRAGGSGTVADGAADVISGDGGDDTLDGGAGEDLLTYNRTPEPVVVDLGTGAATGQGTDELRSIEAVQGSRLADTLIGGAGPDVLLGNLGDDKIDGKGGADTVMFADLVGPVEVDLRDGSVTGEGSGSDSLTDVENLVGTDQDDVLRGDDGSNHLNGGRGGDLLVGYAGVDLLDGGAGVDECRDEPAELVGCEGTGPARPGRASPSSAWLTWLQPLHAVDGAGNL